MDRVGGTEVRTMTPIELAVSCLLRWNGWERQSLMDLVDGLQVELNAVETRTRGAPEPCLGQPKRVLRNIEEARRMITASRKRLAHSAGISKIA